ncbi:MAG: peptide chain release factor N(5)-glutamine methyltransferase [Ignavibacteriaceae bacterium]
MITVLELIKLSTEYLEKKEVESPRANAEILLADILNCKRIDLYLTFDKPLAENELQLYRESIRKRAARIPLQYIIGNVDFYGLKFNVNNSVLIPRPETELLVEKIITDFKDINDLKILDIGSGSGNISLSLGKNLNSSTIIGIDVSEKSIEVANQNKVISDVQNVEFKLFDVMKDDPSILGKFNVVVSNPPYISEVDYHSLKPELKVYEPKIALTDNYDGLSFYKKIIFLSKMLLYNPGYLYFELGKDQHKDVNQLMIDEKFSNIKVIKDYAGIERIICGELR